MTNWKLAVNWWTQQSLGFDFCLKRDALTGTSISAVAERRKVTSSRVISLKIWHRFHDIYTWCVRHTKANRWANKEKIANVFMKLAMLYLSYELLCLHSLTALRSRVDQRFGIEVRKCFSFYNPRSIEETNKFNHWIML